jgi:hypothetical protein
VWTLAPGPGWCAELAAIAGDGDVVELLPGDYPGGCALTVGGLVDTNEALLLTSVDLADPAVIRVAPGDIGLVVAAPVVRLFGLRVEGAGDGTGVLGLADGLTVQQVTFTGLQVGVEARLGSPYGAALLELTLTSVRSPLRVVPGPVPSDAGVVVREAVISGWDAVAVEVNAGRAVVFDNVIGPGPGAGIQVGAGDVFTNVVLGGATDGGAIAIDVAAGSARRNAVVGGDLRVGPGAVAFSNTVVDGEVLRDGGVAERNVVSGAAAPGDVACDAGCFTDLAALDLSPAPGSPLLAVGDPLDGPDLCDRVGDPPALGATDGPGPITLEVRPLAELCLAIAAEPSDAEPPARGGCGREPVSLGLLAPGLLWTAGGRRRAARQPPCCAASVYSTHTMAPGGGT